MLLDVGPLARQLVRRDDELLLGQRDEPAKHDTHGRVRGNGEGREPEEFLPKHAVHHETGREQRRGGGEANARQQTRGRRRSSRPASGPVVEYSSAAESTIQSWAREEENSSKTSSAPDVARRARAPPTHAGREHDARRA